MCRSNLLNALENPCMGNPYFYLLLCQCRMLKKNIIPEAKLLRKSIDRYTEENIFINRDRVCLESEEFKKSRVYCHNHTSKNSLAPGSLSSIILPVMSTVSTVISHFELHCHLLILSLYQTSRSKNRGYHQVEA